MKKVNFKNFLMTLSMALAFLLLGLGQANAQAQISASPNAGTNTGVFAKGGIYGIPQGPFVNANAAQTVLEAALVDLKDQMLQLQQGSAPFNAILNKYMYYSQINEILKLGQTTVDEAIVLALKRMSQMGLSQSTLQLLRQEVIDLLHA